MTAIIISLSCKIWLHVALSEVSQASVFVCYISLELYVSLRLAALQMGGRGLWLLTDTASHCPPDPSAVESLSVLRAGMLLEQATRWLISL